MRKITFNNVLTVILFLAICFSIINIAGATAPNPGHNFSEIGGGAVQGDILYGSATDTISALAKDTNTTRYLSNTGTNNNPAWAQINLANGVTGILPTANGGSGTANFTVAGPSSNHTYTFPNADATIAYLNGGQTFTGGLTINGGLTLGTDLTVANGGTGLSSITVNDLIYGNGANNVSLLAPGATTGAVLMNTASGAPSWSLLSSLPSTAGALPAANGGTGQASYTIGDLLYASATSALSRLADSASGSYLRSGGTGVAPVWSTVTIPNTASQGDVWYGSAANTVSALGAGTAGSYLRTGGAGANPTWGNPTKAVFVSNANSCTDTTSTTAKMTGFGLTYTTMAAGNTAGTAIVTLNFQITAPTTASLNTKYKLYYGTGSAPSCNGTASGTAVGNQYQLNTISTYGGSWEKSLTAVITGLAANTAYWFDLQAADSSTASWIYSLPQLSVIEM